MVSGEIGRLISSDDEEVIFNSSTEYDEEADGWKTTITWEGPTDRVFEDCFDFGKLKPNC